MSLTKGLIFVAGHAAVVDSGTLRDSVFRSNHAANFVYVCRETVNLLVLSAHFVTIPDPYPPL